MEDHYRSVNFFFKTAAYQLFNDWKLFIVDDLTNIKIYTSADVGFQL